MQQRTISFLLSPTHPDYKAFREQAVQVRRLFNGLNSVARIVHAKRHQALTKVEEQPVDERLVKVFEAESWVEANPNLAGAYSYETLRKKVERIQGIQLPQKVAQRAGINLGKAWKAFYETRKKGLYSNPPGYKQVYGVVEYTKQALSFKTPGGVKPTGWAHGVRLPEYINTKQVQAARLVHSHGRVFKLELIYNDITVHPQTKGTHTAGIDFGLDNLVTLVTDMPGERPKVVSGRELKSINQFYNKRTAKVKQGLVRGGEKTSNKYRTLWAKRNRKINHHLHSVSSQTIKYLVNTGVGTLVIGWNNGFKDSINIGKRNNQNFVLLPHARLRDMLKYKAEQAGIKVVVQEESYTSQASFIDNDPMPVYPSSTPSVFSGKRTSRGNYTTKNGLKIHADVNGAWNIIRKSNPTTRWSSGIVVMPERLRTVT